MSYVLVIFVFQNISRISSAHNCTVVDKIVAEIGPDFENMHAATFEVCLCNLTSVSTILIHM